MTTICSQPALHKTYSSLLESIEPGIPERLCPVTNRPANWNLRAVLCLNIDNPVASLVHLDIGHKLLGVGLPLIVLWVGVHLLASLLLLEQLLLLLL